MTGDKFLCGRQGLCLLRTDGVSEGFAITAGEGGVAGKGDGGSIWEIGSGVVSAWISISAWLVLLGDIRGDWEWLTLVGTS